MSTWAETNYTPLPLEVSMNQLESAVIMYKAAVDELSKASTLLQEIKAKEAESFAEKYAVELDRLIRCQDICDKIRPEVERLALADYSENKNKKLFGGIGIQERKNLEYDQATAFNFAKEKGMFISFDKKAFEKVAESLNLDFVKSKTEPKVTFPAIIKVGENV